MILTILKIIGIALLIILGIIIFLLLYILFVPIKYQLDGKYFEKADMDAVIKWFPVLLKATVSYHNDELRYIVKLLGGVIMTNTDAKISFLGRKLFAQEENVEEEVSKEVSKEVSETIGKVVPDVTEEDIFGTFEETVFEDENNSRLKVEKDIKNQQKEDNHKKKVKKKRISVFTKIRNKINEIIEKIKNFIESLKKLNEKKENLLKVYHSKRFEKAKKDVILYIKKLFQIIKPKKLEGKLHLGLKDPASTGELFGVFAVFLPLYAGHFELRPEFEYECLEGNVFCKGKFSLFPIVILALKIIFNKNLIKVTKRVQTIIER